MMAAGIYEIIGSRVHSERERAGLSQDSLAELVGVKREAISRLERGQNATIGFLARVAYALKTDLAGLVQDVVLTAQLLEELEAMSKPRGRRSN